MGFCCYSLLYVTSKLPFDALSLAALQKQVIQCQYSFPPGFPDGPKDLIQKVLKVEPSERLSLEQIKEHPWFSQNWQKSILLPPLKEVQEEEFDEEIINAFELIGALTGVTISSNLSSNSTLSFTLNSPLKTAKKHLLDKIKKVGIVKKQDENNFHVIISSNSLEIEVSPKELSKDTTIVAVNLINGKQFDFETFFSNFKRSCDV